MSAVAVSSSSNMLADILHDGYRTYLVAGCYPRDTTSVAGIGLQHVIVARQRHYQLSGGCGVIAS